MVLTQLSTKVKNIWRLWAKALGEKSGATDQEADRIAYIRTAIVLIYIITNFFIIAGVVRHW
jgi:hypothetical protein